MALDIDATSEGKLTCVFENDLRNLTNFDPSTRKSQNLHFNGLLLVKVHDLFFFLVWALSPPHQRKFQGVKVHDL